MSRKADTFVWCDVCLSAGYRVGEMEDESLMYRRPEWFNGSVEQFLWKHFAKDIDVCPKCVTIINRAEHLGLALNIPWETSQCPKIGRFRKIERGNMEDYPAEEEYQVKYLEAIENMLDGLDEDIVAKYIRRVNRKPPYSISWHGWEPWLEQLCRNVSKLTETIASLDSYYRHGISDC